jgi:putative membrane protein
MDGAWWWVMVLGWLVFLLVILGLGFLVVRHLTQPTSPGPGHSASPEAILAERFASGEIDEDEYRRRRDTLVRRTE